MHLGDDGRTPPNILYLDGGTVPTGIQPYPNEIESHVQTSSQCKSNAPEMNQDET